MKLYAVAVYAKREVTRCFTIEISHGTIANYLIASNEDEAKGLAFSWGKRRLPQADGWGSHDVSVCEVSREFIERAYHDLEQVQP